MTDFNPTTAYADDYVHLGPLAVDATLTAKDAGGQGTTDYWVKICWDDGSTADYGGGTPSFGSQLSNVVLWKASSGASDPTSGDVLTVAAVAYVIMAVVDTRRGSWHLTLRKGKTNA